MSEESVVYAYMQVINLDDKLDNHKEASNVYYKVHNISKMSDVIAGYWHIHSTIITNRI